MMCTKNMVTKMSKTVVVIGGGAAGMIACGTAAKHADAVILIDKNAKLGRKVRITGKGRCNITNIANPEEMLSHIPTNPKFLYSALYSFTNYDIIALLQKYGVETKVERGGRVFPVSDNAHDVAEALMRFALADNVRHVRDEALSLIVTGDTVAGVKCRNHTFYAEHIILATGGKSYPLTGSDGKGYILAQQAGHTIISPKPSLIPIVTKEKWVADVKGLSLKNVCLHVINSNNKEIFSEQGEMLFTHFGVSGPIVLSASAHMQKADKYRIYIDLKPALSREQLEKRVIRDFEKKLNKHFLHALDDLLPKSLIPVVIEYSGISPHKEVHQITREERQQLIELLKGLPLTVQGFRPIEEAIVTSGGVKTSEIDPSTMRSKLVQGLSFAGEMIDVDAYTGGFNLQIAFSTGYLAGENV